MDLSRNIILDIDLDTGKISTTSNNYFYNTDRNIAYFYLKLYRTNIIGQKEYISNADSTNYKVTLTAIKPETISPLKLESENINDDSIDSNVVYKITIPNELMKQQGFVYCEGHVIYNNQELTTDCFSFKINPDKLTEYNLTLITDPDLPILQELINQVKYDVRGIKDGEISDSSVWSSEYTNTKFNEKADKNEVFSMANMGQDIKTAMTGGSVAVVGINSVLQENIVNGQVVPMKTSFMETGKNLLDENILLAGYLHSDGSLKSGNYKTTTYIPFNNDSVINLSRMDQPNTNNLMTRRAIRIACFYDSNYNLISDYYYNNSSNLAESVTYKGSSNVSYIRVSIGNGFIDGKSMLYLGNELTEFEDVSYKIEKLRLNESLKKDVELLINDNKLNGKTIIGFGDSIMRGAGNSNVGIVDLIAKANNMTCINKAVSGATILADTDNNIPKQIEDCTDSADYVVIDGYINDCLLSGIEDKLGTVSQYFGSSFDTATLAGQLETMLRNVQNQFIGSKILYVFVHTMSSRDNEIVKKVHEVVKECCKKWSIPIVDLYEEGILNTMISGHKIYTSNSDGTHPTEEGYELYYIPQIESKLKML